jgi:hypothetical protein
MYSSVVSGVYSGVASLQWCGKMQVGGVYSGVVSGVYSSVVSGV